MRDLRKNGVRSGVHLDAPNSAYYLYASVDISPLYTNIAECMVYRGLLTQLTFLLFSIFSLCRMYYQVVDPQTMVLQTDEGPYN